MLTDVHVHSKYSKRPSQWILKKIGCPECFTEPIDIYQIAKSRGMTHVTMTADHIEKLADQCDRQPFLPQ